MKAEIGKRYALIQGGRCHWKFDITTLPEWHAGISVVEITGLMPEPDEGDLFDGTTFSKPPVPPAPPVPPREPGSAELMRALVKKGLITEVEVRAELPKGL